MLSTIQRLTACGVVLTVVGVAIAGGGACRCGGPPEFAAGGVAGSCFRETGLGAEDVGVLYRHGGQPHCTAQGGGMDCNMPDICCPLGWVGYYTCDHLVDEYDCIEVQECGSVCCPIAPQFRSILIVCDGQVFTITFVVCETA